MFRNNGLLHHNVIIAAGLLSSVLPVGRFSRTVGLFFSLRCGKFFAVAGCVFWASFIKVHVVFWAVFEKNFSIKKYSFCQIC